MKDYTLSEQRAITEAYFSTMSNRRRDDMKKIVEKINVETRSKIASFSVGDEVEFYLQKDTRFSSDGRTKPWGRVYAPYVNAGRGVIEEIGKEFSFPDSDRIHCQFVVKVIEYYPGRYQGNDFGSRKVLRLDVDQISKKQ